MQRVPGILLAAAIHATGGFCLGMLFYMRVCNRMPSGPLKRRLGRSVLLGLTGAGAAAGLASGWTVWLWVSVCAVTLFALFEAIAVHARRRFRAEGPVETRAVSSARWFTTRALHVLRFEINAPWHGGGPLRIGHLSDLHINDATDPGYLRTVLDRVEQARPHLLLLTGDFVNRETGSDRLSWFLSGLHAPGGVFATLGNHDYAVGAETVRAQLEATGVHVLLGKAMTIESPLNRRLCLIGDDRPWSDTRPSIGLPLPEGLRIGLAHSPDNVHDFARLGAFAVFSGHLHAGQIRFPVLGPAAVPSRNGRRFEHGHFRIGDTHLFVSAGIGSTFPPFRFRCHPDILLVDLLPKP